MRNEVKLNGFSDNVAFTLGGAVAVMFLGLAMAPRATYRIFNWAAEKFAIAPREP